MIIWESDVGESATDDGVDECMNDRVTEVIVFEAARKSETETLRSTEQDTTELSFGKRTISSIGFSDAVCTEEKDNNQIFDGKDEGREKRPRVPRNNSGPTMVLVQTPFSTSQDLTVESKPQLNDVFPVLEKTAFDTLAV